MNFNVIEVVNFLNLYTTIQTIDIKSKKKLKKWRQVFGRQFLYPNLVYVRKLIIIYILSVDINTIKWIVIIVTYDRISMSFNVTKTLISQPSCIQCIYNSRSCAIDQGKFSGRDRMSLSYPIWGPSHSLPLSLSDSLFALTINSFYRFNE